MLKGTFSATPFLACPNLGIGEKLVEREPRRRNQAPLVRKHQYAILSQCQWLTPQQIPRRGRDDADSSNTVQHDIGAKYKISGIFLSHIYVRPRSRVPHGLCVEIAALAVCPNHAVGPVRPISRIGLH